MARSRTIEADCCIAGGGPAGVMLGMLLARAGLHVVVLEKHADFFRDFRGDTIHPSTIELLGELGLRDAFLALPHTSVARFDAVINGTRLTPVSFATLPGRNDFLALMPQWDFLAFLSGHASVYPGFSLLMGADATDLVWGEDGRVRGVRATDSDGDIEVRATITVAADGRDSTLRAASGLQARDFGAPIDVLWFHLDKPAQNPPDTLAYLDENRMVLTIPREGYYQMGVVIPKGTFASMKKDGLPAFRSAIAASAPFLAPVVSTITDWDQLKPLSVQINRLVRWWQPGLLCIGDAAHAMSPAFGVGVNYALQDAVAAANRLVGPLFAARPAGGDPDRPAARSDGAIDRMRAVDAACAAVQSRRSPPAARMQSVQLVAHRVVDGTGVRLLPNPVPPIMRAVLAVALPVVRILAARLIGRGFRPEHVAPTIRGATTKRS